MLAAHFAIFSANFEEITCLEFLNGDEKDENEDDFGRNCGENCTGSDCGEEEEEEGGRR